MLADAYNNILSLSVSWGKRKATIPKEMDVLLKSFFKKRDVFCEMFELKRPLELKVEKQAVRCGSV